MTDPPSLLLFQSSDLCVTVVHLPFPWQSEDRHALCLLLREWTFLVDDRDRRASNVSCNTTAVLPCCSSQRFRCPVRKLMPHRLKEFAVILVKDTFTKRWSERVRKSQERSAIPKGMHGPGKSLPEQERSYCARETADCQGL